MALYVKPGASGTGASAGDPAAWSNANVFGATSLWTPDNPLVLMQGNNGEAFEIAKTGTGGGALVQTLARAGATGSRSNRLHAYGANASGDPLPRGQHVEIRAVSTGGAYTTAESMFSLGKDTATSAPISYDRWRAIYFNANGVSYNAWNNGNTLGNTTDATQAPSAFHECEDCRFGNAIHNGWSGFAGASGSEAWAGTIMRRCEIFGCGFGAANGRAIISRGSYAASMILIDCSIHDNNGGPRLAGATEMPAIFIGCLFYNNGTDTEGAYLNNTSVTIRRCVFYGNKRGGLNLQQPDPDLCDVSDNIFANNGLEAPNNTNGAGVVDQGLSEILPQDKHYCRRNAYWNNWAKRTPDGLLVPANFLALGLDSGNDEANVTPFGEGEIIADPRFASVVSGAEDLRSMLNSVRTGGCVPLPGFGTQSSMGVPFVPPLPIRVPRL